MGIDPDKYVVFKRQELKELLGGLLHPGRVLDYDIELKDAVVIRKQDRMAAGALYAYATACWLTADVLLEVGKTKEAEELTEIGNFFNEQYEEARNINTKLPTI